MTAETYAEVRVVTDRHGNYNTTRVLRSARTGDVWSPLLRSEAKMKLNFNGYREGDLFPTIGESTVAPHYPWVVWSRYNRGRYDLAWSRWSDGGWRPIRWVEPANESPGDNLDADLTFDTAGRPHVVWWRDENGTGRVYLSAFLDPIWMRPFAVSEEGVDGRYPSIEVVEPGTFVISFQTPEGVAEQTIVFDLPVTITDDINPLDFVHTGSMSIISEGD
jgi:hypothetical protein